MLKVLKCLVWLNLTRYNTTAHFLGSAPDCGLEMCYMRLVSCIFYFLVDLDVKLLISLVLIFHIFQNIDKKKQSSHMTMSIICLEDDKTGLLLFTKSS